MTQSWNESSTWNSIGGGIIEGTNAEASSKITANLGSSDPTTVSIDVTAIVQAWVNGAANYGFGIVNSSNNGFQFASSEVSSGQGSFHAPIIEVNYASAVPEPATAAILGLGLIFLKKPKRKC